MTFSSSFRPNLLLLFSGRLGSNSNTSMQQQTDRPLPLRVLHTYIRTYLRTSLALYMQRCLQGLTPTPHNCLKLQSWQFECFGEEAHKNKLWQFYIPLTLRVACVHIQRASPDKMKEMINKNIFYFSSRFHWVGTLDRVIARHARAWCNLDGCLRRVLFARRKKMWWN